MRDIIVAALRASLVTWVLCGIALSAGARRSGSVADAGSGERQPGKKSDGTIIGSRLIGQAWKGPEWFHGRPSATTDVEPG